MCKHGGGTFLVFLLHIKVGLSVNIGCDFFSKSEIFLYCMQVKVAVFWSFSEEIDSDFFKL